jgi:hypothetical protein
MEEESGFRARVSIEEKGIIVKQKYWPIIEETLKFKNQNLFCKQGNLKTFDYENMRSYCYYDGNCENPGLSSLQIRLPNDMQLEIVKRQYLLQQISPFRCEIMIQALPDDYLYNMNDI